MQLQTVLEQVQLLNQDQIPQISKLIEKAQASIKTEEQKAREKLLLSLKEQIEDE